MVPLLLLASKNPGKLREFREAAGDYKIRVEPVPGIESLPPCVEDGLTFEANARRKALHYARFAQGLVFADDSGICVDALGGAPGVFSARFAGGGATDEANNQKLISELRRRTETAESSCPGDFPAHYECVIALAQRERIITTTEGRADGLIILSPRGNGGFGYDPYFFYTPLGKTFAEIPAEAKFTISHRGIAFRALLEAIREMH